MNLLENIAGCIAAIAISLIVGAVIGNSYGPTAKKLAASEAERVALNKSLRTLQAEQDADHAREAANDKAKADEFAKAHVQKLPINKDTADALNKLVDGG